MVRESCLAEREREGKKDIEFSFLIVGENLSQLVV